MRHPLLTMAALLAVVGGIAVAVALATRSSGPSASKSAVSHASSRPPAPPGSRLVQGSHDAPVPILMYHVLGVPRAGAPYPELYVKPADFAGQMGWLARHGYHAVTLGQVFRYWRRGDALPRKPVVVSFDDGYLSDFVVALPTLRRHGWAGVLDLAVDNIRPGDITAWQVRKLIAAGWEIDAHTISHVDLTGLDATRLRYEVAGSRAAIRKKFGQRVDFFCYPAGRYDAQVIAAVRAAGYLGATTVDPGLASLHEPYTLKRIRIDYGDGPAQLATKLATARG